MGPEERTDGAGNATRAVAAAAPRRRAGLGARIALLAATLAVGLGVAEVVLRQVACRAAGVATFELVRQRYLGNPLAMFPEESPARRIDSLLPGTFADGTIHVNSFGLRGPEVAVPKPPGVVRIQCLGGSAVFGTGNTCDETTWPARLGQFAGRLPGAVEVLNGGVPAFRSYESIYRFEHRLLPLEPDVAVLYNLHNDVLERRIQRLSYDPRLDVPVPVTNALQRLLSYSALYLRVRGLITLGAKRQRLQEAVHLADASAEEQVRREEERVQAVPLSERAAERKRYRAEEAARLESLRANALEREEQRQAATAVGAIRYLAQKDLDDYRGNLERFIAVCRAHGVRPVLCTQALAMRLDGGAEAYRRTGGLLARYMPDYESFRATFQAWNDVVRAVAAEHADVVLFDADLQMQRDPALWDDWVHLNDAGSVVFARLLLRRLVEAGVVGGG